MCALFAYAIMKRSVAPRLPGCRSLVPSHALKFNQLARHVRSDAAAQISFWYFGRVDEGK